MSYNPEMAEHDQRDIRSKEEIEALGIRMTKLQTQLYDLIENQHKIKLLDTPQEWEDAKNEIFSMYKNKTLGRGYLNEILKCGK